jgi:4-amino-4-deoxy-L-arabinose transferase-like glycosyltransferase
MMEMTSEHFLDKRWFWLLVVGIAVNCLGLLSPVLEPDGALYASIAKHMTLTGDYWNLSFRGNDWLDKPHFPFWIISLSYYAFGINTIAYKLPALLFWGIGIWYTYRFAALFYPTSTARLSTLIYITAFHLVLSNNDVRAEPYLTGLIIASVFHFYLGIVNGKLSALIIGSVFAAASIMTKGIFVLITIFSGIVLYQLLQKQFNKSFFYRLILALLITAIFTAPEIVALHIQFDSHPEKIVFGHSGVSGIKFFLWDSQFGRFFNTGPIRGEGDPFFFIHTCLWAFFPWSIAFFASAYTRVRHWNINKYEKITWISVTVSFLLFSLSKFQLPHYINIIFPFMSIQVANFILTLEPKYKKAWTSVFAVQATLCVTVIIFLCKYSLPEIMWPVTVTIVGFAAVSFISMRYVLPFMVRLTIISSLVLYTFISLFFVPMLMRYQAGSEAAFFLRRTEKKITPVVMLEQDGSCSFDFYYPGEVRYLSIDELASRSVKPWVFCNEEFVPILRRNGLTPEVIKSFPYYKVSQPTAEFMNSQLREKHEQYYYLVKIR